MQRSDLLDSILAAPEQDEPRLVFADWCEESGELARAEFIRVQLERARLPAWDVRQVGLKLRERSLLLTHGAQWRAELPQSPGVTWGGFARGFAANAFVDDPSVLGRDEVQRATPLHRLHVAWGSPGLEAMVPMPTVRHLLMARTPGGLEKRPPLLPPPVLARLHALSCVGISTPDLAILIDQPELRDLRALYLWGHDARVLELAFLAEANLPQLSTLLVRSPRVWRVRPNHGFIEQHTRALAAWPGLRRLTRLELPWAADEALATLLRSPFLSSLRALRVSNAGAETLAAVAELPSSLASLNLRIRHSAEDALPRLWASSALQALQSLSLDGLDPEGVPPTVARIDEARFWPTLQTLWVDTFTVTPIVTAALRRAIRLHTLGLMTVDETVPKSLAALFRSDLVRRLHHLDVNDAPLDDGAAIALLEWEDYSALEWLRWVDLPKGDRAHVASTQAGRRLQDEGALDLDTVKPNRLLCEEPESFERTGDPTVMRRPL